MGGLEIVYPSDIASECSESGDGKDEGNAPSHRPLAIVTRDPHRRRAAAHTSAKVAAERTYGELDGSAVRDAFVTGELGGSIKVPQTVVYFLFPRTRARHVDLVVVAQDVVVECGSTRQPLEGRGRGGGLVV